MNDIASTVATIPTSGEETVQDLQLAKALGYKRPTNIRNLIARHRRSLEAIGSLLQREAMIEAGKGATRAVTEFHLTKAQATFLVAKAGTQEADSVLILVSEAFAMLAQGRLAAVDEAAQAELDAAVARGAERHRLMREEKDDRSAALKAIGKSSSRRSLGKKPDGTPILRELAPFEKRRKEELAERKRRYRLEKRSAKERAPGAP